MEGADITRFGKSIGIFVAVLMAASVFASTGSLVFGTARAASGSIWATPNPADTNNYVTVSCSFSAYYYAGAKGATAGCEVDYSTFYSSHAASGSASKTFSPYSLTAGTHTLTMYYATGLTRNLYYTCTYVTVNLPIGVQYTLGDSVLNDKAVLTFWQTCYIILECQVGAINLNTRMQATYDSLGRVISAFPTHPVNDYDPGYWGVVVIEDITTVTMQSSDALATTTVILSVPGCGTEFTFEGFLLFTPTGGTGYNLGFTYSIVPATCGV